MFPPYQRRVVYLLETFMEDASDDAFSSSRLCCFHFLVVVIYSSSCDQDCIEQPTDHLQLLTVTCGSVFV